MYRRHYRPETYKARSSIGYLVKRAHALMLDRLEPEVARHGFTFTQWVVLMHLRDGLALNASDLCAQLRHDSGALTRVIDQLETRGLVVRERSREDRRAVQLRLTQAGQQTVRLLIPLVVDRLNCALRDFSRTEVVELTRLLNKLVDSIESRADDSGEHE
jgi:DNA-binding MarR family transcriptional regulator